MDWQGLMHLICKVHFPEERMQPTTEAQRKDRSRGVRLTKLEKCLVCKMFFTTGLTFTKLADLWGCCDRTIASAVKNWEPKWNKISLMYCRLKVWDKYLLACQPEGWSNRYKKPISHLNDGSVVASTTPRKSSPLGRVMTNNKIHGCGALGLTFSTPTGCGFLAMPLYCGRLSEVAYMSIHQKWFFIIPKGFARLVDKGFARTTRYYPNYNLAYVPAFVRSDTKDLSGAELKDACKQSSDRYTCEVYFSRVKDKSGLLKGVCHHHYFCYLETAWYVGHYNANLQRPLRRPQLYDELADMYARYENLQTKEESEV